MRPCKDKDKDEDTIGRSWLWTLPCQPSGDGSANKSDGNDGDDEDDVVNDNDDVGDSFGYPNEHNHGICNHGTSMQVQHKCFLGKYTPLPEPKKTSVLLEYCFLAVLIQKTEFLFSN